jgi:deoxyribonucleoside regulator
MTSKSSKRKAYHTPLERELLLADVCEMYYLEGKSQTEIGKIVGLTPSMISRLITEAHEKDMVEIRVHRPLQSDVALENALMAHFNLLECRVVTIRDYAVSLLKYLGAVGAETFKRYLEPDSVIGIAWGTTLSAVVDAFEIRTPIPSRLVELTGAMGSRSSEYEGHGIITRLANKLGAEYHFLNAPFLCENAESARVLMKNTIVSHPLKMAEDASVALMGVGSLDQNLATVLRFGYLSKDLLETLRQAGAVGNVCGLYFDAAGQPACRDFCQRIISITKEGLLKIPVRIGVAGGADKVEPILGALRGGHINILVTDNLTARGILTRVESE